ncbi:response regulator transcription factor [Nonomuraea sp. SBT364]|uniref:response regulator transcription factor n=1 Tax=Nonomuraea sp. SBT364 TaxID=1580530 RepID=UPI00066AE2FA|nr:response regulator transcription factor [Nonomuraea sp. SBT364]
MSSRGGRSQRIDVTRLPKDVVALIDDLGPGESVAVMREGASIAAISSTVDVVQGAVVDGDVPDDADDRPPPDYEGVTVVATAMELSAAARLALSTQLGADYVVLDMHAAPATADVLLIPPGSPQLIGALRSMFPQARVVVTEIEDHELGVQYHGPVRRLLDAGADAYLPPATLPHLARQLDYTLNHGREIAGGAAAPLQIAPAVEPADPPDDDEAAG